MTASVAHEMNQPLTAIAMYAQTCKRLLSQGEVNIEKLISALNKLSDQALRAGEVNERVQHFVRNKQEDRQLLDVNQLLEDIRPLAASDARAHGIDLILTLAEDLPATFCSGINLQQVALSLLRNAFDAMAEIDCRNGSEVRLAPSLFDPFVTSKKHGMGLGLSSCRSLITEEGGQLHFENRGQIGAHFYFMLPTAQPARNRDQESPLE